jgi:ribose transport system permease protein
MAGNVSNASLKNAMNTLAHPSLGKLVREFSWEIALATMVVLLMATVDQFASSGNVANILVQISPILLLAVGQTFVLLTGGIDLSQGAVISVASVLLYTLANLVGLPGALMLVSILAVCYYGVVAILVTVPGGGLNSFIVTLATMYMLNGTIMFCTGGTPLTEIDQRSIDIFNFINKATFAVPTSFAIAVFLLLIVALILRRTTVGVLIFAVGGNPVAARAHGLSVIGARTWAYAINGALTVFASLLLTSRIYQGNPHLGEGLLFDSIGGAVLGGVSLAGGTGGVWYAIRGVLLMFLIQNALYLTDLDSSVRDVAVGILILTGFALSLRRRAGE